MLEPDAPAILFDDPLANSQSDAASRIFVSAVQALEQSKDLLGKLRFDSDSVIRDTKNTPAVSLVAADLHTGGLLTAVLDRIANQVLKQVGQTGWMNRNGRHVRGHNRGSRLVEGHPQVL